MFVSKEDAGNITRLNKWDDSGPLWRYHFYHHRESLAFPIVTTFLNSWRAVFNAWPHRNLARSRLAESRREKTVKCWEKNPAEKTDREQPFTRVGEAVSWEDGNLLSQAQNGDERIDSRVRCRITAAKTWPIRFSGSLAQGLFVSSFVCFSLNLQGTLWTLGAWSVP